MSSSTVNGVPTAAPLAKADEVTGRLLHLRLPEGARQRANASEIEILRPDGMMMPAGALDNYFRLFTHSSLLGWVVKQQKHARRAFINRACIYILRVQ